MKVLFLSGSILFLLGITIGSCSYNNELELHPCDSSSATYSLSVKPILETNCYSCHSEGNKALYGNNVGLEGYTNVKSKVDGGYILGNIRHDPGFLAMPKGAPKLSNCDIAKIQSWINKGAPND